MSESNNPPQETPIPPRKWLSNWIRDEKFWRDITTCAVGGVGALTVGFLAGVAGGFIEAKGAREIAIVIIVAAAAAVLLALLAGSLAGMFSDDSQKISVDEAADKIWARRRARRRSGRSQLGRRQNRFKAPKPSTEKPE